MASCGSLAEAEPPVTQLDSPILDSYFHGNRGLVALRRGDETVAVREFAEAIVICERINERSNLVINLIAHVQVLARSDARGAARLLAAAETLIARFALIPDRNERLLLDETDRLLRTTLTPPEFERARRGSSDLSIREIALLVADAST